jgi:hypothetical protein
MELLLDHKVTGVILNKKHRESRANEINLQGSWKQPEKGTSNTSPFAENQIWFLTCRVCPGTKKSGSWGYL